MSMVLLLKKGERHSNIQSRAKYERLATFNETNSTTMKVQVSY